ncbi:MAG: hypothetical protein ACRD1L_11275 [Terriglobales bacterium]
MRWLRWGGPVLALAAVLFLPALQVSAPLLEPVQWSVADLGMQAVRAAHAQPGSNPQSPSLSTMLRQARGLWQQFGGHAAGGGRNLGLALALAALIPAMALAAGLCALLSWAWLAVRWRRAYAINAGVGLAAGAYSSVASWWLTRLLHGEEVRLLARAQHSLGDLLGAQLARGVHAALAAPFGLTPQAGLFVLLLAFAVMLIWPGD